jgi:hypothetical protein
VEGRYLSARTATASFRDATTATSSCGGGVAQEEPGRQTHGDGSAHRFLVNAGLDDADTATIEHVAIHVRVRRCEQVVESYVLAVRDARVKHDFRRCEVVGRGAAEFDEARAILRDESQHLRASQAYRQVL